MERRQVCDFLRAFLFLGVSAGSVAEPAPSGGFPPAIPGVVQEAAEPAAGFLAALAGRILFVLALLLIIVAAAYFTASAVVFLHEYAGRRFKERVLSGAAPRSGRSASSRTRTGGRLSVWRRLSLKSQLIFFTVFLSVLIILLVVAPFGTNMIRKQEQILSENLCEKVDILLSGLASSAKAYMPSCNLLELDFFLDQSFLFTGVEFATVSGRSGAAGEGSGSDSLLHVWASNDPAILSKIDTEELELGVSCIRPDCSDAQYVNEKCLALNYIAASELGDLLESIRALEAERDAHRGVRQASSGTAERLRDVSRQLSELTVRLNASLEHFSREGSGSIPDFNSRLERGVSEYVFYRPVLFRSGDSSDFVQGIVFLKVNTDFLFDDVRSAALGIIVLACVITFFAVALGGIGAIVSARIIVSPIKRLESFVKRLASERHKERLAGDSHNLVVAANDEIGHLCDSVNRLKEELAAAAASDLLQNDGKAVQRAFLPLELADDGLSQKTTARFQGDGFGCFGYYEGAAAISGDYFDFKNLDGRWYALIKSDASGHGTPAGLIMTVVATLFNRFFADWTYGRCGTRIDALVCEMNDFLESLCLDGKFATIVVCLYDSGSGDVFVCNAGDNLLHIFDAAAGRMRTVRLAVAPAAGPFHSRDIGGKCGFQVEKVRLNPGDILFLYTDGIEESTRFVRNSQFQKIHEEDGRMNERKERFGAGRVKDVIEAVMTRGKFILTKVRNPVPDEELAFDFQDCAGSGEEAVVALVSVEKVFRMYRPDGVSAADTVVADREIDSFLKGHFNLYGEYCRRSEASVPEGLARSCTEYNFVMEDDQTDDLAILALHRL